MPGSISQCKAGSPVLFSSAHRHLLHAVVIHFGSCSVFSTLMVKARLESFRVLVTPTFFGFHARILLLLCHKEPARSKQNTLQNTLELVLYDIRLVACNSSTSRWTTLPDSCGSSQCLPVEGTKISFQLRSDTPAPTPPVMINPEYKVVT